MFKNNFYRVLALLSLTVFFSCSEEDGASSGSTSIEGTWRVGGLEQQLSLTTNTDVDVLDSWNEGTGGITLSMTPQDDSLSLPDISANLNYIWFSGVDEDGDFEFMLGNESAWIYGDVMYNIYCYGGSSTQCSSYLYYFGDEYSYYESFYDIPIEWDESSFTLTLPEDHIGDDGGYAITLSGSIAAGTTTLEANVPTILATATNADYGGYGYENYVTFNSDGTLTSQQVIDCSAIDADDEWDCDYGCVPTYDSYGNVAGCEDEDVNCSELTDYYCWDYYSCEWDYGDDECVDYGEYYDDDDTMLWSVSGNQLILTYDGGYSMIYDMTTDGENMILSTSRDYCDDYYYYDYYYYDYECDYSDVADDIYMDYQ